MGNKARIHTSLRQQVKDQKAEISELEGHLQYAVEYGEDMQGRVNKIRTLCMEWEKMPFIKRMISARGIITKIKSA